MSHKIIAFTFSLFCFFTTIHAQETTIKTWYVEDTKMACKVGDVTTSCYRIKDSSNGEWRDFPYEIEGFVHEKGFEYLIEVSLEKLKFTEGTGPSYKYALVRIVSQKSTVFTDKRLLVNNTFRLINIEQYGRMTLSVKSKATIKFGIDTNEISGFAGCNSFSGPCTYAEAFMEFGTMNNTLMTCEFQNIEDKLMQSLKGRATFYVRKGMLYVVCENFMTLHLKPERSLDSIFAVIEADKLPKNDINFSKTEDGMYIVNAPTSEREGLMRFNYKTVKLTAEEKKKIKLKLVPFGPSMDIKEIRILNKPNEKPHMFYATVIYADGKKKDIEIRDAD